MARINTPAVNTRKTHEGATAAVINAKQELRRSVMANMLWEGEFYEDGERVWDITGSEYEGMWEFSSATVKKHSYDRDPYVALARMIIKSME